MVQLWRSFGDLLPYAVPLAIAAVVALIWWPRLSGQARGTARRIYLLAWVIAVLLVTMQREMGVTDVNGVVHRRNLDLVPLHDLYNLATHDAALSVFFSQTAGNLCLFAPFGLYLVINEHTSRLPVFRVFVLGLCAGIAIEIAQWVLATGRISSTDDALLAGAGTAAGFAICRAILALAERSQSKSGLRKQRRKASDAI